MPQRSGGFVYKQWGAGSAAPPGGQCGPGKRVDPGVPRPPKPGGGAGGGTEGRPHPGRAPAGGGDRGRLAGRGVCGSCGRGLRPSNSRLLAPRSPGGRGRRTWRRGGGCDSGGASGTAVGARVCGVVDLQVSRLGVCVCLTPSLRWGLQGVVVSIRRNVGIRDPPGRMRESPRVCVGFCLRVGCTCVYVLCESCLCMQLGAESAGLSPTCATVCSGDVLVLLERAACVYPCDVRVCGALFASSCLCGPRLSLCLSPGHVSLPVFVTLCLAAEG